MDCLSKKTYQAVFNNVQGRLVICCANFSTFFPSSLDIEGPGSLTLFYNENLVIEKVVLTQNEKEYEKPADLFQDISQLLKESFEEDYKDPNYLHLSEEDLLSLRKIIKEDTNNLNYFEDLLSEEMERYLWKGNYFFKFYIQRPRSLYQLLLKRINFTSSENRYVTLSSLKFSHPVHNQGDTRLERRIELAKSLPPDRASMEEIQNLMFSGTPIRVVGSEILDGHGRVFAILQSKGPDYQVEVEWSESED